MVKISPIFIYRSPNVETLHVGAGLVDVHMDVDASE